MVVGWFYKLPLIWFLPPILLAKRVALSKLYNLKTLPSVSKEGAMTISTCGICLV
jgi:hypothetical protein